ncbi:MAG: cation diffusion facilitator family transporter [Ignavibacteria bacterium]
MSHSHDHSHSTNFERPIIIGIVLNSAFIIIEIIYGIISNSIALITDAGHNFSDVISLILAWFAIWLIKKKSTKKFTYGFKKGSILIALINSILLLVALGAITWEALQRLYSPHQVEGKIVILVASAGIIINGITAYLFVKGKEDDLNIKSAFLHMLTDTLVSVGVVISGILILYFNLEWIDPVISLIIVAVILIGTWGLLKETISLSMDAAPDKVDTNEVQKYLSSIEGVSGVHDLHIWSMSTSQVALTTHIVCNNEIENDTLLEIIRTDLHRKFGIEHSTIQIENNNDKGDCLQCDCD